MNKSLEAAVAGYFSQEQKTKKAAAEILRKIAGSIMDQTGLPSNSLEFEWNSEAPKVNWSDLMSEMISDWCPDSRTWGVRLFCTIRSDAGRMVLFFKINVGVFEGEAVVRVRGVQEKTFSLQGDDSDLACLNISKAMCEDMLNTVENFSNWKSSALGSCEEKVMGFGAILAGQ